MLPEPISLHGRTVTLTPINERDIDAQTRAVAETISPGVLDMLCGTPETTNHEDLREYLLAFVRGDARVPFLVTNTESGAPLGLTCYLSERPDDRAVEIGGTWLRKEAHGSAANPDMKLAMLRHAFEDLGLARVQLRGDNLNERSKAAIEKLGAHFEGVLRKHIPVRRCDGTLERLRDTFVYSITDDEWPACRAKIEAYLESRLTKPIQI